MTRLPSRTVLLVPSKELGWGEVRNALRSMPDVRVIEASSAPQAVEIAASERPHVAIIAAALDQGQTPRLVRDLRQILARDATILVVGTRFNPDELAALAEAGATSAVLWSDLSVDLLSQALQLIVIGEFVITSRSLGEAFFQGGWGRGPVEGIAAVNERERRLLGHLAQGMTQKQIASAENLSQRTVRRLIGQTRSKLGAPNLFVLGVNAVRMRLLP